MEDERRKRALRFLNAMGVTQCLIGVVLLFLGLGAQLQHGDHSDGVPPYYTGAYIGMAVMFVQAALGLVIYIRGKDCVNKLEASEKIGCVMQSYCLLAIFGQVGNLVATLLVGFTGICKNSRCSYLQTGENRRFAVAILVFILFGVIISAIGLAIVCKFSSSFGLKMLSRGQYQISTLVDNTDAVIAYIAAEQTTGNDAAENQARISSNHHHHHHHHHHHERDDPRLTLPMPDYSTQHLQSYLTHQYRDRIRKRRKKNRKRQKQDKQEGVDETRRHRNGRESQYYLPPLVAPAGDYGHRSRSPVHTPPPPPPSPPPVPVHYPPPSPPPLSELTSVPHAMTSPPLSRRTPPLTPSALRLPHFTHPAGTPPPHDHSYPPTTPPTTPPPASPPPPYHQGIIHVIPCGETLDEDMSLYSMP